ncbi:unnamed protein product [Allacma fusca]|uniref:Mitochondrial cardiolipin hydrolase n=1 Tax=Allacma fusca TaxID=39272 RepID=A0A8J2LBR3_9HEXA|nr:unnamed protein product [Allacma fusca]
MLLNVAVKQFVSILNHLVKVEALSCNSRPATTGRSKGSKMWSLVSFVTTAAVSSLVTIGVVKYLDRKKDKSQEEGTKEEKEYEIAQRKLQFRKPEKIWNTVLFFENGVTTDPELASLKTFVHYLDSARATIQLCLYRMSHWTLGDVLLKKFNKRRGLLIQIITDYDVFTSIDKGTTRLFRKCFDEGMSLKVRRSKSHMHHKFAIIDGEAVLTGSLNWTEQAFTGNHEDVLVTTNPLHVDKYMQRFRTLWRNSQDPADLMAK